MACLDIPLLMKNTTWSKPSGSLLASPGLALRLEKAKQFIA
uniref:Uncharacterized protein n=1 Tax=Anguilla anguilla TaxID=7936 RepID=A0A0E9SBN1_ANGAN